VVAERLVVAVFDLPLAAIAEPRDGSPVLGLARAIQLSVAPVFLLTGISALLGVLSTRLTRVLDRARDLQNQTLPTKDDDLQVLKRRMRLLTRAIESVTVTGVLVAAVVAVTFVSAVAVVDLAAIVVPLFVLAMLSLIGALLLLLRDTQIASVLIERRF
jgi:Na+/melibiose symporter-like transporter